MADRTEKSQRAALFSTFESVSSKHSYAPNRALYANVTTEILERENDQQLEDLEAHVQGLKAVGLNLQSEVQESSRILESLRGHFTSAGSLLQNTLKRVESLASGSGGRHICVFVLFVVLFIGCLYFFFSK